MREPVPVSHIHFDHTRKGLRSVPSPGTAPFCRLCRHFPRQAGESTFHTIPAKEHGAFPVIGSRGAKRNIAHYESHGRIISAPTALPSAYFPFVGAAICRPQSAKRNIASPSEKHKTCRTFYCSAGFLSFIYGNASVHASPRGGNVSAPLRSL